MKRLPYVTDVYPVLRVEPGKFRNLVGNIIAVYGFYRSPKALGQLHMFFQAFLIAGRSAGGRIRTAS